MGDLTRGTTLPNESSKTNFHNLVDTATVASNKITTAMMQADSVVRAKIGADAVGADEVDQTATITVAGLGVTTDGVVLTEGTAPTTAAGQGGIFTKDIGGQPELVYVEESDGDEVQITSGGQVGSTTSASDYVIKAWANLSYSSTWSKDGGYNASVAGSQSGNGTVNITWDTDFSSDAYSCVATVIDGTPGVATISAQSTTGVTLVFTDPSSAGTPLGVNVMAIGAQ